MVKYAYNALHCFMDDSLPCKTAQQGTTTNNIVVSDQGAIMYLSNGNVDIPENKFDRKFPLQQNLQ